MTTVTQQQLEWTVSFFKKIAKNKNTKWFMIALLTIIVIIQFTLPFGAIEESYLTSFQLLQYKNQHWTFNYFYFIITIVGGITICRYIQKTDKKFANYEILLWIIASFWTGFWMEPMSNFIQTIYIPRDGFFAEIHIGWLLSLIVIRIWTLINIGERLISDTKKYIQKTETSRKNFMNAIKNKSILYKTTIILNPKRNMIITDPYISLIAITKQEIIISGNTITTIPIKNIQEVKLNTIMTELRLGTPIKIICKDWKTYKITSYIEPTKKAVIRFDLEKTKKIKQKIEKAMKK